MRFVVDVGLVPFGGVWFTRSIFFFSIFVVVFPFAV